MPRSARPASLSSVFSYLLKATRYFERQARPDMVYWYRDALDLTGEMVYGQPPATEPRRIVVMDVPCPMVDRVPPWKEQLLARPLRKIVSVQVIREQNQATGAWSISWNEKLECGHVNVHIPFMPDEARARRRRCRECQSKTRAVQSIMAAQPATAKQSLCTSALPVGSVSSSAVGAANYSTAARSK